MGRQPSRAPRRTNCILLAVLLAGLSPVPVLAQQPGAGPPAPRLFTVVPCGGQAGSTFELTVTGQDFDAPQGLHFSHRGVKVEPLGPATPTVVAVKGKPAPKQGGPRVGHRFRVTLPADTPHGIHDVRVVTQWGVSNPRAFVVGALGGY